VAACSSSATTAPIALGVSLSNAPGDGSVIDHYAKQVGGRPAIVMWFQSWSEPLFYTNQILNVEARHAIPLITWDPVLGERGVRLADIAAGDEDQYLIKAAHLAAGIKKPFLVRLAHEMNLSSSPFGPGVDGNTPQAFVASWRHVVDLFRREGATNVRWVWSPNTDCGGGCPFKDFYPGDAWVDWVALDGYNTGHVGWRSLDEVFGSSYRQLVDLTGKPVMIAETSSTEAGGDKGAWIRQGLLQQVPTDLSRVSAVIWFDQRTDGDWRVNSSPSALAAFREVVRSRTYSGDLSGSFG
jgi:hypothetical protein